MLPAVGSLQPSNGRVNLPLRRGVLFTEGVYILAYLLLMNKPRNGQKPRLKDVKQISDDDSTN